MLLIPREMGPTRLLAQHHNAPWSAWNGNRAGPGLVDFAKLSQNEMALFLNGIDIVLGAIARALAKGCALVAGLSYGVGTNRPGLESRGVMRIVLLVLLTVSCALPLAPQGQQGSSTNDGALKAFLGTWKGACGDGKDFVVVTFTQLEGGSLGGSVQLANMRGGDDGQCATVVDPPSDKHALTITDAKLGGSELTFRGAKRMEFAMSLQKGNDARLRFIGTASEDNPWKLKRVQ